jgi:cbb3-type cytochrome oxidase maturation protein
MEILFLLIPLAVVLMVVAVVFFLWTVKTGQYDDLEGAAHRILMDDDDPLIPGNARKQTRPEGSPEGGASEGKSEDDRPQ